MLASNLREYGEEDEVDDGVDEAPGDVEDGEEEGREEVEPVVVPQPQHHQPVAANIDQAPDQAEHGKSWQEKDFEKTESWI